MIDKTLPEIPSLNYPVVEQTPNHEFDVAMIIDGIVFQIINMDGNTAAQYLSNPTFVQILPGHAKIGWVYQDGTFSPPSSLPGL
jgi:hypothetical protein